LNTASASAFANGPAAGVKRQQQQIGQAGVGGDEVQGGVDCVLGAIAIDQRRAQRCVGMRPSDQDGQPHAIASSFDADREQPFEPIRLAVGPHQNGSDLAPERGRSRERERRLVEDVGLERARGERPPCIGDIGERRQLPPLRMQPATGRLMCRRWRVGARPIVEPSPRISCRDIGHDQRPSALPISAARAR